MPGFRQTVAGMNRKAVQGCIANNDQKYGRQLASTFERFSLLLRAHFGGKPLWTALEKMGLQRARKRDDG